MEARTEHEHDVEEYDKQDRDGIDRKARLAHPEGTLGDIFPAGEEMRADGETVGDGGEDDEGADQVGESGFASELDGAEGGAEDSCRMLVSHSIVSGGQGVLYYQLARSQVRDS